MTVCIAEKPSVGKDIARVLGAIHAHDGYMEGGGYQVTWTLGHLCQLKEPDDYREDWKKWSLDTLPMIPEPFGIKVKDNPGVKKQFRIVRELFRKADRIINCGDAGQEGELIQRWVMQEVGVRCPVDRLWISSLTESAIRDGFASLRPQKDYDRLYMAGLSRAVGDWLLGMNATRLYSLKYGNRQVLSIGRVQTPTLALIVARDEEIERFVPEPYWVLSTEYRGVTFQSVEGRYPTEEACRKAFGLIEGRPFVVTDVQKKKGQESPKQLFDLTQLQVECNRRYGMSADQTLSTIQSLYEKKVTTYPRVDTQYLSDDIYPQCGRILRGLRGFGHVVDELLSRPLKKSRRVFDSSKVTDHHAIIPTGQQADLSDREDKVYQLICGRFVAVFMDDCEYATTTVLGQAGEVGFKATGREILSPGWRQLYGKDQEEGEEQAAQPVLPVFVVGEQGAHSPTLQRKETVPPKPYTEASLLQAMETAGKFVDDDELKALMKENGIGRPSSRASIIETLFSRQYIVREKRTVRSTAVGRSLIHLIRSDLLKSCELTGRWEKKLRDIERGQYDSHTFVKELKEQLLSIVNDVRNDRSGQVVSSLQKVQPKGKGAVKGAVARKGGARKTVRTHATPAKSKTVVKEGDKCPLCGKGTVRKGQWGLYCDQYRSGCKFRQK